MGVCRMRTPFIMCVCCEALEVLVWKSAGTTSLIPAGADGEAASLSLQPIPHNGELLTCHKGWRMWALQHSAQRTASIL